MNKRFESPILQGVGIQVVIYSKGLGKILSSSTMERSCANEEEMKNDLYFLQVKSFICASRGGGESVS